MDHELVLLACPRARYPLLNLVSLSKCGFETLEQLTLPVQASTVAKERRATTVRTVTDVIKDHKSVLVMG
jgi:hypothetical protein